MRRERVAADESLLGQQVFIKETAKPKLGNKVIPWNEVGMPATVTKIDGDWLWVGKAWVKSGEVVGRDDAPTLLRHGAKSRSRVPPTPICCAAWPGA